MRDTASDSFFSIACEAGIAHLRLDRPERLNAMTFDFFGALQKAVEDLDAKGATRVLVVSSTGKHFSAGMSLEAFESGGALPSMATARERQGFQRLLARLMESLSALEAARFPVVCAVQGGCIGGGLDLACACDIRICSSDAFFVVQETAIGMAADLGSLQRLPKIVPPGIAREMAYTAERLPAARALACGLVNEVLPDAAATVDRALALAAQIAARSPLAVAGSKAALNYARDHPTDAALQQMTLLQSAIFDPAEIAVAVAAWKQKQAASFAALAGD